MKILNSFLYVILLINCINAQVLYDPQTLYEAPQGIFDKDSLRTISINFYDPNYHDTLELGWFNETGKRLPASLSMGSIFLDSVAVRYKGNSTFYIAATNGIPKVPYNIDMNDIVSGQKLMGMKKIKLANALFDPTFVKEMTGYRIYRNYMPSPEANLMKLEVQGSYLGLYVNTESVGSQFLKKHFGEKDGTLFKCDPTAQYGSGVPFQNSDLIYYGSDTSLYTEHYQLKSDSLSGWYELLELIDILNNDPSNIDTILNVDRVLWYFALNQVLANTDTYNYLVQHNFYLYRTEDGLFQIIPWDLSETFIGAMLNWLGDPDLIYETNPNFGHTPFQSGHPLVYRLLSNPLYHKQYTAHLRTVYEEQLVDSTNIFNIANNAQILGYTAAQQDPWKFFSMSVFSYNLYEWIPWFTIKIAGIMRTVQERKAFLSTFPDMLLSPPQILSVYQSDSFPVAGDSVYITADVTGASQVDLMVTINKLNSRFQAIPMVDDGTNGDSIAADGIYTALIPYNASGDVVKYYIRSQNSDAMSLNPKRAEYEFYIYSVTSPVNTTKLIDHKTLRVFPNPVIKTAFIEFEGGVIEKMDLVDLTGKLVLSISDINKQDFSLDCNLLSSGVYILNVKTNLGLFSRQLIIDN
ncbi:MAG: CotH kinase family protein [Saprospiraceae bacterium]|nr:CotH kinase family protein [Saprospiraceae bacterium]